MPNLSDISDQRQPIDIPFGDWVPDHPAFRNPGFPNLRNAFPADTGVYKPFPGPVLEGNNTIKDLVSTVTNNAGQLQGFRKPDTNLAYYYTAAVDIPGDTFHLFQYDESADTWADVTPTVPPTAVFDGHAYFSVFGTRIYATSGVSTSLLAKDIGTAGLFTAISGAPRFRDAVVIRGFMMGINFLRGIAPFDLVTTGVSWSAAGDPENWIDPVADPIGALEVLRGEIQLEGGGRLKRIMPGIGGADAIILGQSKIWRVTFIGPPAVWDFQIVEEEEGLILSTTAISDGNKIYFYGRRGWMEFDGANARPIGASRVDYAFIRQDGDATFSQNGDPLIGFNRGLRSGLFGQPFADNVAAFLYRSDTDDTFDNLLTDTSATIDTDQGDPIEARITSSFPDTMLFYNTVTGKWGNAKADLQVIGRVESNQLRTNTPQFLGLNDNLDLVRFRGDNLEAIFDSAEATGVVNNPITVRKVWPYINNVNCTIQLLYRNNLGEAVQISPTNLLESDAAIPVDESGRFVALRMTIPEGEDWPDGFIGLSAEFSDQGIGSVV